MDNSSLASNLSTIASYPEMSLANVLYGSISYSIIFFVGLLGNLLVIYVFLNRRDFRNFTNYLLANLSFADLMVLFACVPTGLHDLFAKERWYLGKLACYSVAFIENCMGFASILSIFFITCDRYYVICRPLAVRSLMNQARTMKLICFIWFVSIVINLPLIYLTEYRTKYFNDGEVANSCNVKSRSNWSLYYIICITFVFYLLIGLVLVCLYLRITHQLNKSTNFLATSSSYSTHRHSRDDLRSTAYTRDEISRVDFTECYDLKRLNSHGSLMGGPASMIRVQSQSLIDPSRSPLQPDKHVKQRKQLILMLICVILAFYICLFPLKIWNLVLMYGTSIEGFFKSLEYNHYWFINITTRIFFYLNSSINPILYNCLSKKFRTYCKGLPLVRVCCGRTSKRQMPTNTLRSVNFIHQNQYQQPAHQLLAQQHNVKDGNNREEGGDSSRKHKSHLLVSRPKMRQCSFSDNRF
nr:G protein-coupled receptor [Proales similis]